VIWCSSHIDINMIQLHVYYCNKFITTNNNKSLIALTTKMTSISVVLVQEVHCKKQISVENGK